LIKLLFSEKQILIASLVFILLANTTNLTFPKTVDEKTIKDWVNTAEATESNDKKVCEDYNGEWKKVVLRLTNSNSLGSSIAPNINTDTSSSNINTAGGLVASSFSSPPTIAQGTEQDLSALEKIEKLKQQWLDLLP